MNFWNILFSLAKQLAVTLFRLFLLGVFIFCKASEACFRIAANALERVIE
ncbi:MAG: hypothetical protein AAF611_07750 [Bacteroidota bacterium]